MNKSFNASRRQLHRAALAAALLLAGNVAGAQNWPDKPIRLVVGGPPGGRRRCWVSRSSSRTSPVPRGCWVRRNC